MGKKWQPTLIFLPGKSHRQTWRAILHVVTKSQTQLKRLNNNNNNWIHSLQRPRIGWSTDFQLKFQGNSVGFVFLTMLKYMLQHRSVLKILCEKNIYIYYAK